MNAFRFLAGEEFASARPNQSFDFSSTHLNSDLDTTYVEVALRSKIELNERLHVNAGYRYVDFRDDAPYLGDDTGSLDFFSVGLGWVF